jgi:hypothetical protein
MLMPVFLNKWNKKCITLVSLYWYTIMHGQQNVKLNLWYTCKYLQYERCTLFKFKSAASKFKLIAPYFFDVYAALYLLILNFGLGHRNIFPNTSVPVNDYPYSAHSRWTHYLRQTPPLITVFTKILSAEALRIYHSVYWKLYWELCLPAFTYIEQLPIWWMPHLALFLVRTSTTCNSIVWS